MKNSLSKIKSNFIYLLTFIVAFCSIVYELLLANEISLVAGNTVVWYSLVIGFYLGFLGMGSLVYARFLKKEKLERKLFLLEVALSLLGASSVLLVRASHIFSIFVLAQGLGGKSIFVFFGVSFFAVALIGFLSGIELPVLIDIANNEKKTDVSNRTLAFDYFGSLLGAVAFPLFFAPNFGGIQIGFFVAILNFSVAVWLAFFYREKLFQKRKIAGIFFLAVTAVLFLGSFFSQRAEQFLAKKYYYYPQAVETFQSLLSSMEDFPLVVRQQSPYQTIDLVEPVEFSPSDVLVNAYIDRSGIDLPDDLDERTLYLNGDWQMTTTTERIYHEYFAHVPVQVCEKVPEKVLLLGGGDGMLLREILKYSQVKKVFQVELDEKIVELASSDAVLSKINAGAFSDSRVEMVYGDGYAFLQGNEEQFDAVYVDFPVPKDYNVSKLYSREFYSFVARAISDEGYLALYAPGLTEFQSFDEKGWMRVDQERTPWKEYYNTLKAGGFVTVLPFFSNLERDNMTARMMVEEFVLGQEGEAENLLGVEIDENLLRQKKAEQISGIMEKFSVSMQESFIFAQKKPFKGKFNYSDFGAGYAVMNKMRFFTSFQILLEGKKEIEWQYVNSILKPTLPKFSPWTIRFPYYLQ